MFDLNSAPPEVEDQDEDVAFPGEEDDSDQIPPV
jgi:hypothetical protein